jgi:hypothetical protein
VLPEQSYMTMLSVRVGFVVGEHRQSVRACQILLNLAGMDGPALWNAQGPTRRASWLKGYLRRAQHAPTRTGSPQPAHVSGGGGGARQPTDPLAGRLAPIGALSRAERIMLLVAFDFWNGSGDAALPDVLGLPPRLVGAIADLMAASLPDAGAGALDRWAARWAYPWGG